ncbi:MULTISPECIES: hypothetical protein [unclassified Streptomyces]|uniref:hypothetical protein n=1 Tax=unclassified Streptomyces TaxID=2593676 RepID=UPI001BEC04CB|nr:MULTISPECIES: hypothetical protein [unclassified Streptomyces]MBT2406615.1 hypothetical protein [Streptomyces sp. ISL-21]MBT2458083.1 hypothetical protein [Streptomyces sp. ISL-86]MBT2608953.1 hypothetical protein [Streptomyces sp. ISL-87]
MRTLPLSTSRWPRRLAVTATAMAVVGLGVAPTATATAPAATSVGMVAPAGSTPTDLDKAPAGLYLFQYTYRGHLKIGGGNFTLGGRVYVAVKFNSGQVKYHGTVTAKTNSGVPGGAVYLETNISAPCAPGNNGYAQAYDYSTQTWSPRLPVAICVRLD